MAPIQYDVQHANYNVPGKCDLCHPMQAKWNIYICLWGVQKIRIRQLASADIQMTAFSAAENFAQRTNYISGKEQSLRMLAYQKKYRKRKTQKLIERS